MSRSVSKCGIYCSVCPWGPYPRKNMTPEEFEQYRNNAKRILGYMPIKTPCLTCQTPDSQIPKGAKLPNKKCLIRQCVDKADVANCAYCSRFPCDTLKATADVWNRKKIEEKLGSPISERDYQLFVEPFEGIGRLEAIRASLRPEEIVEPPKVQVSKARIVNFPVNLPFKEEDITSLKTIHNLLHTIKRSSLGLTDTDTFAQQHKLENIRTHVLRFLWILGRHGRLKEDKDTYLVAGAKTYLDNRGTEKTLAIWPFVEDTVFKALSELGVHCERVALEGVKEEDLVTGTGYLRSTGWEMRMSLERKSGAATLIALRAYTGRLDEKYGRKAFQRFRDAEIV